MMMSRCVAVAVILVATTAGWAVAGERGLVASWDLDGGRGPLARDASGHENHGAIHGAKWVKLPRGFALEFDGVDDYVNCGRGPSLNLTGPVTLEAWINPVGKPSGDAGVAGKFFDGYLLTYYRDGNCWWYIASGSNHCRAYVAMKTWHHVAGTFDGTCFALYVDGRVRARKKSRLAGPGVGKDFLIGCVLPGARATHAGYANICFFKGMVDAVRVYDRALDEKEIAGHFRSEADCYGLDTRWFHRLKVTPFVYQHRGEVVVEVDYDGLLPLPKGARIAVRLRPIRRADGKASVQDREIAVSPEQGAAEVAFSLAGSKPGSYQIEAGFTTEGICPVEKTQFTWAVPKPVVPPPSKTAVPPLPPEPAPPAFGIDVSRDGGFWIRLDGQRYPVETWVSYPKGEFNWLAASRTPTHQQEPSWNVTISQAGAKEYQVTAGGRFYTVKRRLVVQDDHVKVEDTYVNNTNQDLGLLIYNHLYARGKGFSAYYTAGYESLGRKDEAACPSVFAGKQGAGLGLLPLDDVSIVQSVCYTDPQYVRIGTEKFALGPNKPYTVQWAVYVNRTGDFYDFINAVRAGEDRIGTIDGGFAFISKGPFNRRNIPSNRFIELRNIKYGAVHCLSGAADDPQVSIEGIEFVDFPKEKALLRQQMDAIHRRHPGLKVIVHVAHSLYATNNPDRFPDSKVIQADGRQTVWEDPDHRYISAERQQQGWRWWIYYPTPGNSFHQALMNSIDVMLDDIGADGFFMDGFLWGYRGRWTYDRWDGHSAEIDPQTRTIKRKMGSVLLLSQPSLIQFARRVRDKGGVIVANNAVFTRSICREKYIIHDREVHSGPYVQLAPTCTALTNPTAIKREKDVYLDALDKLKWGMLFFYYQEGELTHPSLPARSFPMTFEEIRAGTVKGPQRMVTMVPGVYGWRGEPNLHIVHRYDARGGLAAYDVLTTSDASGVRSLLQLKTNESAVVEKLPMALKSPAPVNVIVLRYDAEAIRLVMNGKGPATLEIKTGAFAVAPGATYRVKGARRTSVKAGANGILSIPFHLDGQLEIGVRRP